MKQFCVTKWEHLAGKITLLIQDPNSRVVGVKCNFALLVTWLDPIRLALRYAGECYALQGMQLAIRRLTTTCAYFSYLHQSSEVRDRGECSASIQAQVLGLAPPGRIKFLSWDWKIPLHPSYGMITWKLRITWWIRYNNVCFKLCVGLHFCIDLSYFMSD